MSRGKRGVRGEKRSPEGGVLGVRIYGCDVRRKRTEGGNNQKKKGVRGGIKDWGCHRKRRKKGSRILRHGGKREGLTN